MYNNFPNYSYTFYVSNVDDEFIPLNNNFNVQANELGHLYSTICEKNKIQYGHGVESEGELATVGKEMLDRIIAVKTDPVKSDSLSVHRVYYYFENGKIIKDDKKLYTANVE